MLSHYTSLLLPLHRTSLFPQPLQKDNNPSPHTQPFQIRTIPRKSPTPLPPLSKGGGLTARHKLLPVAFYLRHTRPFYHQTFLPSRRRDCYTVPRSAPTLPKPHHPTHLSCCECDSPTSHKNKIRPRFHGGELIKSLIYKY